MGEPGSVVDSALNCESGVPGFEPRWRIHCGIRGKALLSIQKEYLTYIINLIVTLIIISYVIDFTNYQ